MKKPNYARQSQRPDPKSLSRGEVRTIAQELRNMLMPEIREALVVANQEPRFWSLHRVLVYLGIDDKQPSRWTVYRWIKEGKLPPAVETPVGKRWLPETVESFAKKVIDAA